MITNKERALFDKLFDEIMSELPPEVKDRLKKIPVIVKDEPPEEDLFGVYFESNQEDLSSHESKEIFFPEHIEIFRSSILRLCGRNKRHLKKEIYLTLLHEFGHHLGLSEEELEKLGF